MESKSSGKLPADATGPTTAGRRGEDRRRAARRSHSALAGAGRPRVRPLCRTGRPGAGQAHTRPCGTALGSPAHHNHSRSCGRKEPDCRCRTRYSRSCCHCRPRRVQIRRRGDERRPILSPCALFAPPLPPTTACALAPIDPAQATAPALVIDSPRLSEECSRSPRDRARSVSRRSPGR